MDSTEALRLLGLHPAFSDSEPSEREEILAACDLLHAEPGHAFIKEGSKGEAALILLAGRAEVTKIGLSGGSHRLSEIHAGSLLGEVGLLTPHPRTATVTAMEPVDYLRLERGRFQSLLDAGSSAARKLLSHVATSLVERMRVMNDRFVELLEHEHVKTGPADLEDLKARLRRALVHQL